MNIDQIRNPHLIYPGQVLFLEKSNGRARLHVADVSEPGPHRRLSPRIRNETLDDNAMPRFHCT